MKRRLAIFGAGDHGRVVADCAQAAGWDRIELFDDGVDEAAGPWPVSGRRDDLIDQMADFDGVVVGIGSNATRLRLTQDLIAAGAPLVTLIHPRATVSPHAGVGAGSVVFAGAVINIGAQLETAVVVNTGATVDHDCVLDDGVHIAPGAHLAGGIRVGTLSWVGVGATVREYTAIGARVVVGAGSVVVKPIADGLTVVGNPARPLER